MRYHIARAQVWAMGEIKTKQGQLITALFCARLAHAAELLYKKARGRKSSQARAQKKYNKVARSQVISYLADCTQKIN